MKEREGGRYLGKLTLTLFGIGMGLVFGELILRAVYYQRSSEHGFALRQTALIVRERLGLHGGRLNAAAFEATYRDRRIPVAPEGPRGGWGERMAPANTSCGWLGTCARAMDLPGVFEVDSGGFQRVGEREDPRPHVLILGASVAFGGHASSLANTYFARLVEALKPKFPGIGVSVLARGAALSSDDLAAFVLRGLPEHPDLVVFLNGLNDLVNPGWSNDPVLPGWSERERRLRIRNYLRNMKLAQTIAQQAGIPVVFALQPFLGGKALKSPLERRILHVSWPQYEQRINPLYRQIGEGLERLVAEVEGAYFVDFSGLFDDQVATTFTDQWHFSDPGNQILGDRLARELAPLLRAAERAP